MCDSLKENEGVQDPPAGHDCPDAEEQRSVPRRLLVWLNSSFSSFGVFPCSSRKNSCFFRIPSFEPIFHLWSSSSIPQNRQISRYFHVFIPDGMRSCRTFDSGFEVVYQSEASVAIRSFVHSVGTWTGPLFLKSALLKHKPTNHKITVPSG